MTEVLAIIVDSEPSEILGTVSIISEPVAVVTTAPDAETVAALSAAGATEIYIPEGPADQVGTADVGEGVAAVKHYGPLYC